MRARIGRKVVALRPFPKRRPLPGAVIIGAQRAGTSSLFEYLSASPSIAPSAIKEVHFFDHHYHRGENWYRRYFPLRSEGRIALEATPYLLFHPLAPERVARTLPHARFIALLRNPIDRAYSHHGKSVRLGYETLSFEEAIAAEPDRLEGLERSLAEGGVARSLAHREHSYLSRGHYADQLRRWYQHVEPQRILTVSSERFFADPSQTLKQIAAWLGIEPPELTTYPQYGSTTKAGMDREARARLAAYFRPKNEALYALIGERFEWDE